MVEGGERGGGNVCKDPLHVGHGRLLIPRSPRGEGGAAPLVLRYG